MRVTKIEIKNFRAFYGGHQLDLDKTGKNLLVYGENGSGKSTLYLGLKLLLESSEIASTGEDASTGFEKNQNIFVTDDGHIKLHLRADPGANEHIYEWSRTVKETEDELIIAASKAKGFLDYKALLETHFIHRESDTVNVFELLIRNLLTNVNNDVTDQSIGEDWKRILELLPSRRNAKTQIGTLEERLEDFNRGVAGQLAELKTNASEILHKFGYNDKVVALDFDFQGVKYNRNNNGLDNQQILLKVKFFDRDRPAHHNFLNEAKLSAIALSIYFAGFLLQPTSNLKILALDDVLIGLDMSNRLPVLDILEEDFTDYQIVLTTYDKAWYEIVKQRTTEKEWKYAEFYFSKADECEIPIYVENKAYLEKAKEYLKVNDYKACAIYTRTAFEAMVKKFCEKKNIRVKYRENPKSLTSEDFWRQIKTRRNKDNTLFLTKALIGDIELYRSIVLNPLSHAMIVDIHKQELVNAIKAVEELQNELNPM